MRLIEEYRAGYFVRMLIVLVLALSGFSVHAESPNDELIYFDIPQERADISLTMFAEQANITLVFPYDVVKDTQANELRGEYSTKDAVVKLLLDTGLVPVFDEQGMLEVTAGKQPVAGGQEMKDHRKTGVVATTAAMAVLASNGAAAQNDDGAESVLEEVIVTAQKRAQSLSEVGITVNAFSSQSIIENRILTSQDIAAHTPNLTVVNQLSTSLPTYHIRGVGLNDFVSNNTSTVGIYADGVFQTSPAMHGFQLFDMERVEVLKGPQGTLYGRNTTGGAINFIAKKPTYEQDGYISVDYGSFQEGHVAAAYSNALSDNAAWRGAINYEFGDGYVTNRVTGNDLHAKDRISARLLFDWNPSDSINVLVNIHGGRDRSDAGMTQNQGLLDPAGLGPLPPILLAQCAPLIAGQSFDFGSTPGLCVDPLGYFDSDNDLFAGDYDFEPDQIDDFVGGSITLNWSINDTYSLTSVTAFESYERFAQEDLDSSPFPVIHVNFQDDIDQVTQEIRLDYVSDDVNWVAGVYFAQDEVNTLNDDQCLDDNPGLTVPFCVLGEYQQALSQETSAAAAFLHTEFRFADTWNLTLAGRYSYEEKDFSLRLDAMDFLLAVTGGAFGGPVLNPVDNADFNSFSWKIGLDNQLSDDVLLYGTISEGFKTGGFPGAFSFGGPEQLLPFDDESLLAYEVGIKSTGLENRLRFNAAAFYYDYQDVQLFESFTSAGGASIQRLTNGADAEILGLEVEVEFWPTENLQLTADIGWLDDELTNFTVDPTQPPTPGVPGPPDANGNKLANSPDLTFAGTAKYIWALDSGELSARVKGFYQSEVFFETFNQPFLSEDGYWLLDANITYASEDGAYEVSIWGQNLAEEERVTFGFPFAASGLNFVTANQPRRYGVTFRYNF